MNAEGWWDDEPEWDDESEWEDEPRNDPKEEEARQTLIDRLEANVERVYYMRQLQVLLEDEFFHWITSRAIRGLRDDDVLRGETRTLKHGGSIKLVWHRKYRYWKRAADRLVTLVERYSNPGMSRALGLQGEAHVSDGFGRFHFVQRGRNVREYNGVQWTETNHDLDFVFERDGRAYGVEVKNKLGYMDEEEMNVKIRLSEHIGVVPVFVVRWAPKSWINDVRKRGGFTLVLKHQLYPWGYEELAEKVRTKLELPVAVPVRLMDGTIRRFERWHEKNA